MQTSRAIPTFPTKSHEAVARIVADYFYNDPRIDTVLVVNSCARGQGVPESDLDFAILAKPNLPKKDKRTIEKNWIKYAKGQSEISAYQAASKFHHLHLDLIDGNYTPTILEIGVASDYFELEIGNQICYSAPMGSTGHYFQELRAKWLPYYEEELRQQRLQMLKDACQYDIDHIPLFVRRGLYFQAFDILAKAFQEYLQMLFVACKTYPIAYNKWIKYQIVELLKLPDLYRKLPSILSVCNIESDEINLKATLLQDLLNELK